MSEFTQPMARRTPADDGPAREQRRLDANKANVMAFYDLTFNQSKPAEAMERHAGEVYTQHNPHVADGKLCKWDSDSPALRGEGCSRQSWVD